MASNINDRSLLNPLKFRKKGYVNPLPYNFKYLDEWNFYETIPDFFDKKRYFQPWQKNDIIYLQHLANYSPHNIRMIDCKGTRIDSFSMAYVPTSIEGIGEKAYQVAIAMNGYPEGAYKFELDSGNPIIETLETEWIYLKTKWNNTIKFLYYNDENDFDVAFETGIQFGFRIHGGMTEFQPGSDKVIFIDQIRNAKQLLSRSFYSYKLLLGDAGGIPDYMAQIVNEIFNCSHVEIDGHQFTATDGKMTRTGDFTNPLAGWSMEIREADKRSSRRTVTDGNGNVSSSVVYQIEGNRGFGPKTGPASSNVIQIIKLN